MKVNPAISRGAGLFIRNSERLPGLSNSIHLFLTLHFTVSPETIESSSRYRNLLFYPMRDASAGSASSYSGFSLSIIGQGDGTMGCIT